MQTQVMILVQELNPTLNFTSHKFGTGTKKSTRVDNWGSASIEVAWLTVKHHPGQPDEEARLQKRITTTNAPGTGYITDTGGLDVDGDLRFDITQADTANLGTRRYVHDIQIKLTSGMIYTIEKGTIQLEADVTKGTA